MLLQIETDLLDSPWQLDDVGGETFPHVYGPIPPTAVIEVTAIPAGRRGDRV